jgi:hypothetical protein
LSGNHFSQNCCWWPWPLTFWPKKQSQPSFSSRQYAYQESSKSKKKHWSYRPETTCGNGQTDGRIDGQTWLRQYPFGQIGRGGKNLTMHFSSTSSLPLLPILLVIIVHIRHILTTLKTNNGTKSFT